MQGDRGEPSAANRFSPALSVSVADDKAFSAFVDGPVVEDITSVPGISAAVAGYLAAANISTTHQLLGCFLALRSPGISRKDLAQRFFELLRSDGGAEKERAAAIVVAIAAKCNQFIPGIFDPEDYDEAPGAPAAGGAGGGAKKK